MISTDKCKQEKNLDKYNFNFEMYFFKEKKMINRDLKYFNKEF